MVCLPLSNTLISPLLYRTASAVKVLKSFRVKQLPHFLQKYQFWESRCSLVDRKGKALLGSLSKAAAINGACSF